MMDTDHSMGKRREYRVPLTIPVTLSSTDTTRPFKGYIENISSHGALARIAASLPKETFLKLFFEVPGTGKQVETEGTVKWYKENGDCRLGIKFQEKVSFNLPLYEVAGLYPRSIIKTSTDYYDEQRDLLQKNIIASQPLTYWGALFWTFSEPVYKLFFQLSGQLGLSLLRFEKFYRQMENFPADPELKSKARKAISTLELVSGKFNEAGAVFLSLKEKQYAYPVKSRCHINLNRMIKDKNKFLQDITIKLTSRKCNISFLLKEDLPLVYGQHSDFAQSMEFLLLYSYQSILFGNCTEIIVQSMVKNQTIQIDFFNNGSKLFKEDNIVIDRINSNFLDQLPQRDVKNILGLYYLLVPLKKYKACIVVQSESGNNIISLRIPVIVES
ncbi:MAG: PilZ domain-containing protein [Deltaproteobacteria bacterium]|nr:PilZ domain-containing protein [Deltaproteobacteria bacterium]